MLGEFLRNDRIDRQHDLAAQRLGLGQDIARVRDQIVLAERFADRLALRGKECVRHAAADDQRLDLRQQVAEQIELGRNFGAADDGRNRMLRHLEGALQRIEFGLHGAARIGRQVGDRHDSGIGGMFAMRRRERVVDEDVAERRELLRELLVVLFFAGMKARVFETENVAVLHRGNRGLRFRPDAIFGESHRTADDPRDLGNHRPQRIFRIRPPFGRPKCDSRITLPPLPASSLMVGAISLDAGCVGDLAVLHRHVEVHAQQHALSFNVGVVEAAKSRHRSASSG